VDAVSVILGALAAGSVAGFKDAAQVSVVDAWRFVRDRVTSTFGDADDAVGSAALTLFENDPEVPAAIEMMGTRLREHPALMADEELVAAARTVQATLPAGGPTSSIVAHVVNVWATSGGTAIGVANGPVTIHAPRDAQEMAADPANPSRPESN
jgi:hypothetical protein